MTRLVLIQAAHVATYINREQIAVIATGEPPTLGVVAEIFQSPEFWEKLA